MSPTAKENLQGCLVAVISLVVIGFLGLKACSASMCETTLYQRVTATKGWLSARVQMTDCGAVSGFSRVVMVSPSFLPETNEFSCRALALNGQPDVRLRWSNDGGLIISHNAPLNDVIAVDDSCFFAPITISRITA